MGLSQHWGEIRNVLFSRSCAKILGVLMLFLLVFLSREMSSEKRQRQPVHRGPEGPQSTWGDRDDCLAGSSPCHSVGLGGDGGHGMWGYRVWDVGCDIWIWDT